MVILKTSDGHLYASVFLDDSPLATVNEDDPIVKLLDYSKEGDDELLKMTGLDMFTKLLASRKSKIDAEDEKNRRRNFVYNKFSSIEDSVIDKIYKDMCNSEFRTMSGFYVENDIISGGPKVVPQRRYFDEGLEYDYTKSPAENMRMLDDMIEKAGYTYKQYRRYQNVRYIVRGLYQSKAFSNPKGIALSGNINVFDAVKLIMLLKQPEVYDIPYSKVDEATRGLNGSKGAESFSINVESVAVKRFKNGRIDISGLSESEVEELMTFLKIKEKIIISRQEN